MNYIEGERFRVDSRGFAAFEYVADDVVIDYCLSKT